MNEDIELKMRVLFLNDMLLELIHLMSSKGYVSTNEVKKIRLKLKKRAKQEYNQAPEKRRYIENPPIYNGMIGELDILEKSKYLNHD